MIKTGSGDEGSLPEADPPQVESPSTAAMLRSLSYASSHTIPCQFQERTDNLLSFTYKDLQIINKSLSKSGSGFLKDYPCADTTLCVSVDLKET